MSPRPARLPGPRWAAEAAHAGVTVPRSAMAAATGPLAGHEPDLELAILPLATTMAAAMGDWVGD